MDDCLVLGLLVCFLGVCLSRSSIEGGGDKIIFVSSSSSSLWLITLRRIFGFHYQLVRNWLVLVF